MRVNQFIIKWATFPLENGGEAVVLEKKVFEELCRRGHVGFHAQSEQPTLADALAEISEQGTVQ